MHSGQAALLARPEVRDALVAFATEGPNHGAWLGAWVLMPDHLHAFVSLDDERLTLSAFVKSLKNALSKILRTSGIPSPHRQKGFFDHVLRSSESYEQKWQYVRENAVRAGLVSHADEWAFQGESHPLEFRRS